MKQHLTTLVASLLCLSVSAQKNDFSGYYVSTNGDTIKGVIINFTSFDNSPQTILFKAEGSVETKELTPVDCRIIKVNDLNSFYSYSGQRAINASSLSVMGADDTSYVYKPISAFLRIVYQSPTSLLAVLKDNIRENFYIEKAGGKPQELLYRITSASGGINHINTYRQQLATLFADSIGNNKKLLDKITASTYNESDLVAILKTLDNNRYIPKKQKGELQILAGVSLSSFNISEGNPGYPFSVTDYDNSVFPTLAIGYNIYTRRGNSGIYFTPQVRYFKNSHSGSAIQPVTGNKHTNKFEASSIFLGAFINKNLVSRQDLKWYAALGFGANLRLNYQHTETIYGSNSTTSTTDNSSENIKGNILLQTGLMFSKRLGAFACYKIPHNLSNYQNFETKSSSLQAGIEIRL